MTETVQVQQGTGAYITLRFCRQEGTFGESSFPLLGSHTYLRLSICMIAKPGVRSPPEPWPQGSVPFTPPPPRA